MAGYFTEDTMTPGERERFRAYGTFLLGAGGLYLWMTSREGAPVKIATTGNAKLKKVEVTQVTGFGVPNDKEVNLSATNRTVEGFDMSLSIGVIVTGTGNLSASVSATYDNGTSSETKQLGGDEQADYTAFTINNRDFTKADKSIKSYTVAVTAKDGSAVSATTFTVGA
ncbi:hypothetical protein N9N26_00905 [Candidatus Poseidoniales archaeon]|jgi:hypothetical protein|nr:hypothetical protein [Candidatus Poseidoniales archaeon]